MTSLTLSRKPSILHLDITVDDVIDVAPEFFQTDYITAVDADAEIGTYVTMVTSDVITKLIDVIDLQVNATDRDLNDVITYKILDVKNSAGKFFNLFGINKETGEIKTKKKLRSDIG